MHQALEKTFEKYDNTELATTGQGPISDADKLTLKYNLRKQDLKDNEHLNKLYYIQKLTEKVTKNKCICSDFLIKE